MLLAPNVAAHSYYDSVYLKIFTGKLKTFVFCHCILDLRNFFLLKNPQICNTWIYRELGPTSVRQTRTVELEWLEHLWDHENMFETRVVRANEC